MLAAALACLAMPAGPALAQTQARLSAPAAQDGNQLVLVIRKLITDGRYDEARRVIREYRPGDATHAYRVRYVEGLIARKQGRNAEAISTFRQILAERPEFTFVRLDLTQTLYEAGEDDQARHNAELLIAAGVDDKIGGGMRSLVGALDDRRPVRFRGYFSVLPSSNINGGTDNTTVFIGGLPFSIAPEARRQSGIGVQLGGELSLRHKLEGDIALIGSLATMIRYYPAIGRADFTGEVAAGVEKRFQRAKLTYALVGRQDFQDMRAAFREAGVQVDASVLFGQSWRAYGKLRMTARDFINEVARDGLRMEVSGFVDRFFGPQRFVRMIGGYVNESTQAGTFAFQEVQGGLGVSSELPFGLTAYAQATYGFRHYREPLPLFGFRKDHRIEAQATLTKRDFQLIGLAPQLSYSFVRNISNYVFEDTTSHSVELRFVRNF